jgi:hypothetical protein
MMLDLTTNDTAAEAPTVDQADGLTGLWEDTRAPVTDGGAPIQWAKDEIEHAQARHPDQADGLFHAFGLLRPPPGMPDVEFVYRGHARELLERVAAGEDTRPATAAEVCLVCSESSLQTLPTSAAIGLYCRMWAQAFPGQQQPGGEALEYYEALHRLEIDDLERRVRRGAAVPGRWLREVGCSGRHHGQEVTCRYAKPVRPAPAASWGKPYGSVAYQTSKGEVRLRRRRQACRWYTPDGRQVGPEQPNVAPALAYAHSQGWTEIHPNPPPTEGAPP